MLQFCKLWVVETWLQGYGVKDQMHIKYSTVQYNTKCTNFITQIQSTSVVVNRQSVGNWAYWNVMFWPSNKIDFYFQTFWLTKYPPSATIKDGDCLDKKHYKGTSITFDCLFISINCYTQIFIYSLLYKWMLFISSSRYSSLFLANCLGRQFLPPALCWSGTQLSNCLD